MADERIVLEFVGDASGLKPVEDVLEGINTLTKEQAEILKKTQVEAEKLGGSFLKGSEGAKRLEQELNKTPKTLAEMEVKLVKLKELLRDDTKIGTQGFKAVTNEIKKTQKAIDQANSKLKETKKQGEGLISQFKKVGAALGIAFGVTQIIAFGKEAITLAANAEGIRTAFAKLDSPNLLENLRAATRGAVGDVELMTSAIKAKNFKIPLENLASYFEFATKRSIETGESVQFLVESIVNGIGRKSTLVLDNLGISAVELQEEFKRTGDFGEAAGNIIAKSLEQTGEVADTTAIKIARLNNVWGTFKEDSGQVLIKIAETIGETSPIFDANRTAVESYSAALKGLKAGELTTELTDQKKAAEDASVVFAKYIETYKGTANLIEQIAGTSVYQREKEQLRLKLALENEKLKLLEEQIELTNELSAVSGGGDFDFYTPEQIERMKQANEIQEVAIISISSLNEDIKKLRNTMNDSAVGSEAFLSAFAELELKTRELAEAMRMLAGKDGSLGQLRFDLRVLEEELNTVTAGGSAFWQILDKITAKTRELSEAVAMTNLAEALEIDTDEEYEIPDISDQVDKFKEDTKNATDFADDAWSTHFEALMSEQDSAFENAKGNNAKQLEQFNAMAESITQVFSMITALNIREIEAEQKALDHQLKNREITEEEYERKSLALRKKRAEAKKEEALFTAIINTATAVTNALAQENYAAAIAAGILGALNIAIIASQPVPEFAQGVIGIQGPGTETSDSIAAKLSKGESVMTAQETRKHRGALEAMRNNKWDEYLGQQMNLRLFAGGLNVRDDIQVSKRADGIDYDKLAAAFSDKMRFQDGNLIRAIDNHRRTDKDGFVFLAEQLSKNKPRKRGGYA